MSDDYHKTIDVGMSPNLLLGGAIIMIILCYTYIHLNIHYYYFCNIEKSEVNQSLWFVEGCQNIVCFNLMTYCRRDISRTYQRDICPSEIKQFLNVTNVLRRCNVHQIYVPELPWVFCCSNKEILSYVPQYVPVLNLFENGLQNRGMNYLQGALLIFPIK